MKSNPFKKIILAVLLIYAPAQTMAWGLLGHRIIGEIAGTYLTGKTSREIKKILGNESLAMASNWADFIKSEPAYNYLGSWHYINLPAGLEQSRLEQILKTDTTVNAYTQILFLSSELKNKSLSPDKKLMYLRLLIHIVGDLHQPMHTGRLEDLGGNRIQVNWFGQPANLHQVWDSDLIDSQRLSYTEYAKAINSIDKAPLLQLLNEDPSRWVMDSYVISERIYSGVKQDDKLSYRYIYDYISVAEQQLLKGGIHLAALLNDIFK